MAGFRLSRPAQSDLKQILATSAERWGEDARQRYAKLLVWRLCERSQPIQTTRPRGIETISFLVSVASTCDMLAESAVPAPSDSRCTSSTIASASPGSSKSFASFTNAWNQAGTWVPVSAMRRNDRACDDG